VTEKEKQDYRLMRNALATIADGFENPDEMENTEENFGLSREEYLEMAYENIQSTARMCLSSVPEI